MNFNVYKHIRFRIITHDLRPGEPLNEKEFMNVYQIGRSPLREIFIQLQRDGLIQRFPHSGTFVTPIDFHFFKQIIEIRIDLEGLAGLLAAERITEDQLEMLRQISRKVDDLEEQSEDTEKLRILTQYEFDFHNTLYEATHNKKLRDMLYELHGISARFWYYLVFSRKELLEQFSHVNELLDALTRRNGKRSAEIMQNHIQNFVNKVKDKLLK
jgi:DNA-binding GntR family transcriptional regulator